MEAEVEALGTVVRKRFAAGSKSDHDAVWLECGDQQYILRRPGGNPFSDPELTALVGKRIHARGTVRDYVFFLTGWENASPG
jgi:hypothetical protein